MMNYEQAADRIIKYLEDNHYGHTLISANRVCFNRLGTYLLAEKIPYSPQAAEAWYGSVKDGLSRQQSDFYQTALARLRDVFETGSIRQCHDTRHLLSYTVLNAAFKEELDEFLHSLKGTLSDKTISDCQHSCAGFLIFLQKNGADRISRITYTMILSFYEKDVHHGRWGKSLLNGKIPTMLKYFFEKGKVPYGFTLLFHYLAQGKGSFWNQVPESVHEEICAGIREDDACPAVRLLSYQKILRQFHADLGYTKTTLAAITRAADLLFLFLDMNGYPYSPAIAMAWLNGCGSQFSQDKRSGMRRALCLIAQYHECGQIRPESFFREKPRRFDLLPNWCREAAVRYVTLKTQEGWEPSTLDMIRSCVTRFCSYLDRAGLRSFQDLTEKHIREFNAADIHRTAAGKNAYHVRIRRFLVFPGENGYLSNPMLSASLCRHCAPKETVVVVLSEEEKERLDRAVHSPDSSLSLRDRAVLLLGLKMGMRSSDIVSLKYENIHWDTASIRFIQKKTSVEAELPMPADVGNAIYRYIMQERGKNSSPFVFLSENSPHKPVRRSVCGEALHRALPDRKAEGSGFHVTRKTYATDLLRGGIGADKVAEALGQRGTASVHRYLSLDQERMRMCALDLKSCGIGGWSHGR